MHLPDVTSGALNVFPGNQNPDHSITSTVISQEHMANMKPKMYEMQGSSNHEKPKYYLGI